MRRLAMVAALATAGCGGPVHPTYEFEASYAPNVATPTGRTTLPVVGIFKFSNGLSLGGLGIAAMPLDAARPIMDMPSGWMQISISGTDGTPTDVLQQRVVSHHFHFGDGKQAELFRSPHRYIWPAELDLMAQLAGFELENRYADWVGGDFTADSGSHVSVYRLPTP